MQAEGRATGPLCERMLLGMTGTIGIYDFLYFAEAFRGGVAGELRVIQTPSAARMLDPRIVSTILGCDVWTDMWDERDGVRVPHAELPAWADVFLVMPATANVLSACARGDASGLLTLSVLTSPRPVGFVPHMNRTMWQAPPTRRNVAQLREDGHLVLDPDAGSAETRAVADPEAAPAPAPAPADIKTFVVDLARASGAEIAARAAEGVAYEVEAGPRQPGIREAFAPPAQAER